MVMAKIMVSNVATIIVMATRMAACKTCIATHGEIRVQLHTIRVAES